MKTLPLVSALCVSQNRSHFLKNSIECFQAQTYPNKELILIINQDDSKSKELIHSFQSDEIKYFEVDPNENLTLGELRNLSIEFATGEYICQWDDDDWNNEKRIQVQMEEVLKNKKEASILAYWIIFDKLNRQAYLSYPHMWASTILCKKSVIGKELRYQKLNKFEDTDFLQKLYLKNCLFPIINPSLYVYIFHGKNTMNLQHFSYFFNESQKLSSKTCELISDIIENKYSYHESSKLIDSAEVIGEFDYFKAWRRPTAPAVKESSFIKIKKKILNLVNS